MYRVIWATAVFGGLFPVCAQLNWKTNPAAASSHKASPAAFARTPLRGFEATGEGLFEIQIEGIRVRFFTSGVHFTSVRGVGTEPSTVAFPGSRAVAPKVDGLESWPVRFIGPKGTTVMTGYARIRYPDIYPNTDLVWFVRDGKLEYDWVIHPGGDPGRIRMRLSGGRPSLRGPDVLRHTLAGVELEEHLVTYQSTPEGRRNVDSAFSVSGEEVAFQVGAFDKTRELIIDPALQFLTYLGGAGGDALYDVQFDGQGYLYILGNTTSAALSPPGYSRTAPPPPANWDTFVAKLDPVTLQPLFVSYYGGSGEDLGFRFRVTSTGLIWVAGTTKSANLPASPVPALRSVYQGGLVDAFVMQLGASGQLTYSTYLGGSATDAAYAIDVDEQGSAYVVGYTESDNFPLLSNVYSHGNLEDAFVTKFLSNGTLAYSTCLSGSVSEFGWGVHVLPDHSAIITGYSDSFDFPHANRGYSGSYDAFVTRLSATGNQIVSSGLFGGPGDDQAYGSYLGSDGFLYLTGYNELGGFPVTPNAFQPSSGGGVDNFLLKVNLATYGIEYATYIGGPGKDTGRTVVANAAGMASVGGYTESGVFPALNPLQGRLGASDGYVTVINTVVGNLLHSTPIGTNETSPGESVFGLQLDGTGRLWVAGWASGPGLPTTPGVPQSAYLGSTDGFLMKYADPIVLTVTVNPVSAALYAGQTRQFAATVTNASNPGVTWTLVGAGTLSASGLYTAPATISGVTTVTVRATSVADGVTTGTATITLYPPLVLTLAPSAVSLYAGQTQQFTATVTNAPTTAVSWTLSGPGTLSASGLYTAPASVSVMTNATITATAVADPSKTKTATVTLYPPLVLTLAPSAVSLLSGKSQQFTATVINAPTTAVTWTLSGLGTLSASGLYTAPATVGATSTATVTVTAVADPTKFQTATVTLRNPGVYWKPVEMLLLRYGF